MHLIGIGYLLLFQSEKTQSIVFDANNHEPGIYTSEIDPTFVTFDLPNSPQIVKDETSNKTYLHVPISPTENYCGYLFLQNHHVPADAILEMDWQCDGEFLGIQVDINELLRVEDEQPIEEVFSYYFVRELFLSEDNSHWITTQLPLQYFSPNESQNTDNAADETLNSSRIHQLLILIEPNSSVSLNVSKIQFVYESNKWQWFFGLSLSLLIFGSIFIVKLFGGKKNKYLSFIKNILEQPIEDDAANDSVQLAAASGFQGKEGSSTGWNVTFLLQVCLGLLVLSHLALFVYIVFNSTTEQKTELFNASVFPTGKLAEHFGQFIFQFQSSTQMDVIEEDNGSRKFLRVHEPQTHEFYPGFGFLTNLNVDPNAVIELNWRFSGDPNALELEMVDSSLQPVEQDSGESYSIQIMDMSEDWTKTRIPINRLIWKQNQPPSPSIDRIFNTEAIQKVLVIFFPGEPLTLDLRSIRFISNVDLWHWLFWIVIFIGTGVLLLLRTSRTLLSNSLQVVSTPNIIRVRMVYLFSSLLLFHMFWSTVLMINSNFIFLVIVGMLGLVLIDELIQIRMIPHNIWVFRYFLLFTIAWFTGLNVTPVGLFLWLLAVSIPVLHKNSNIWVYILVMFCTVCLPYFLSYPISIPIETSLFVLFLLICLLGIFQTIHNNMMEKLEIENASFLYEELFRNTSDAIVSFDSNGQIRNVNRGAEKMLGLPKSKLIGSNIKSVVHPDDHQLLPFSSSTQPELQRVYDLRFLGSENKVIHTNISERQSVHSDQITGYQLIARDISKRVELEQLIKEKETVEKANEFKSMFLANMSHELRTPLHGIFASLEIVRSESLTKNQQKFLDMAHSSGKMLLELVNGILDYSRIERGVLVLEKSEISLALILREVCDIIQKQATQKGLQFQSNYPDLEEDMFLGDSLRIRQILLNLLGNAVKFTEKGSITLSVSVESETLDHVRFKFVVTDTGIGIKQEKLDDIFNVFIQSDSSTTRLYGGSGLGLAISKELVHLLGGEIGVESKLDEGSTFWFEIPLQRADSINQSTAS